MARSTNTAVVLAGAVANGAFEAGALEVLASRGCRITRVLGTSAGALNAALFTRYVIAGDQEAGAAALVKLWTEDGTWWRVFRPSLRGILTLTGFSSQDGLLAMLRKHLLPVTSPVVDAGLRIVVTNLLGTAGSIGAEPATTHESVLAFGPEDYASPERLEPLFRAAAASSSFPGAFVPCAVGALGACCDGGVVNNTPVKHVLEDDVERVIVIVPAPRLSHEGAPSDLGVLVGRVADIIVQERLYRDLREALQVNDRLAALEALRAQLGDPLLAQVKAAAGLGSARPLEIVEVRLDETPPNPFAGFFSRNLRERLIQQGRVAATAALAVLDAAPRRVA
jgi:NTE family protein